MGYSRSRRILIVMVLLFSPLAAQAGGSLDNTSAPELGSAMPTTTEIYNQLVSGAAITPSATFRDPLAGPTAGSDKRTLAEIQAVLPQPDNSNGLLPEEVPQCKTFWGLNKDGGAWGLRAGPFQLPLYPPHLERATAADISCGTKAFVNGFLLIGTMNCP